MQSVCLVRLSARDTRGAKDGYHQYRDGPMLHVGCTGVALTASLLVCPAHVFGAWLPDAAVSWRAAGVFRIDGSVWREQVSWRNTEADEWKPLRVREFVRHSSNWWTRLATERGRWKVAGESERDTGLGWFAVLETGSASASPLRLPLAPTLPSRHEQVVAYQNAYGLALGDVFHTLPVTGHIVSRQSGAAVGLLDCICYPGGEGALVTDQHCTVAVGVLVAPLQVDSAPATLSIVVGLK